MSAEILRVHPDEPQPDRIDYIVSCLRKGGVVALPTDTFYGLAVDPVNLDAVEQIYQIKTRQKHKPLSLLIATWPRPTSWRATPIRCWTSWPIASGPARSPSSSAPEPSCRCAPRPTPAMWPCACPTPPFRARWWSASGCPSPPPRPICRAQSECTNAACVRDQIGDRIPLIVDGGPTGHAQPTTIVDLTLGSGRWEVLREGAIPTHEIVMALER